MTNTEEPAGRRGRRAMLALIALATDLPVPDSVSFTVNILSMEIDRIADGQAWSAYLGGATGTYAHKGRVYLREGLIKWHGWPVQLHCSEEGLPDAGLDDDTAARLAAVADQEGGA